MRLFLAPCEDIVVLAECTRVSDLLEQVALKKPDIILLGCETHLENLAQQLHSIAELHPDGKVIVFTGNLSSNFHEAALRNGAKGVLLKQCAPELIAKTVRKVSRGDLCFDRALADRVLSTFRAAQTGRNSTRKGQDLVAYRTGESDHQPHMRRHAEQGNCQQAVY